MSLEDFAAATAEPTTATAAQAPAATDDRYAGMTSPEDEIEIEGSDGDEPAPIEGEGEPEEAVIEADPWEGYVDVEIDGKLAKVPEWAKDGYLRNADYTRKTQETAALRKELEARQQELQTRFQYADEEFQAHVELSTINNRLKAAEGINWNAEYQKILSDPELQNDPLGQQQAVNQFNALHMQWQELMGQKQTLEQKANYYAHTRTEAAQQETAKRLTATRDYAEKNIKGWTPELDAKITEFAIKELGFDADTLAAACNPQIYQTIYYAHLGKQSLTRQQTARPTSPTGQPVATRTVSAKANVSTVPDPEKSSMADYVRARNAGKL